MNNYPISYTISVAISARPDTRALLEAAVAKLDAIVAEGLARDAAEHMNYVSALIEEAIAELEGPRP